QRRPVNRFDEYARDSAVLSRTVSARDLPPLQVRVIDASILRENLSGAMVSLWRKRPGGRGPTQTQNRVDQYGRFLHRRRRSAIESCARKEFVPRQSAGGSTGPRTNHSRG